MMEEISITILFIYGLVLLAVIIILIYLLLKRLDDKKHEDFEKRDN
jgi:uncharacterized membrane protein